MKNLTKAFALLSAAVVFAGCTKKQENKVLTVGATPEPHATILNLLVDDLAKEGITLKVVEFTDFVTPNEAVESGEIDANYFQHKPYMDSFNTEKGYHLVSVVGVHIEPLALYSHKIKSIADIAHGSTIPSPNDPTNEVRALLLLQTAELINIDASLCLTSV